MKKLIIALLVFVSLKTNAQTVANPTLGGFNIYTVSNVLVANPQQLSNGAVYQLKLDVLNLSQVNAIPTGTTIIVIDLGPGLILNPPFNLATAPLSAYFNWVYSAGPVSNTITGFQIAPIPAGFPGATPTPAVFGVKVAVPVMFTPYQITGNWFITNHAPVAGNTLIDQNPLNNSASLVYGANTTNASLPVNFSSANAYGKDCKVILDWKNANDQDVSKYAVEISTDGRTFVEKATASATSNGTHHVEVANVSGANIYYVRIKGIELSGNVVYSRIMTVKDICSTDKAYQLIVYPNPAQNADYVTVLTKSALFNGKIKYTLTDLSGKTIQSKQLELSNDTQFKINISTLSQGVYHIKVYDADGTESSALRFEKLN